MMNTDLTTGCRIRFTEEVFEGSYSNPRYLGDRTITGTITKDSYGTKTGQHTFTIQVETATGKEADVVQCKGTIQRKGRNVYRHCEVLATPDNYHALREDKHERATVAKRGYRLVNGARFDI